MSLELALGIVGAIGAVIVPFVLYSMSKYNDRVKTVEDRVFEMHADSVSKQELKDELRELESRFSISISEKLENVRGEIHSLKELLLVLIKKDQ